MSAPDKLTNEEVAPHGCTETSPITPEVLRVVAGEMKWELGAMQVRPGFGNGAFVGLDNDTDLGNQIAIAQMMLWLNKAQQGGGFSIGSRPGEFGVWLGDGLPEGEGSCLCQALAQAVYAVAKGETQ